MSDNAIKSVLTGLVAGFDKEISSLTQEDLKKRWYFTYNPQKSDAQNLYDFYDMLRLYAGTCRRWEEHHNGSCCVVERVRDTYIWPKIEEFLTHLKK